MGGFVVTPKQGDAGRQPRAVLPTLALVAVLLGVAAYGLVHDRSPSTLNNVAFAALHISVLVAGAWAALRGNRRAAPAAAPRLAPVAASEGERQAA